MNIRPYGDINFIFLVSSSNKMAELQISPHGFSWAMLILKHLAYEHCMAHLPTCS